MSSLKPALVCSPIPSHPPGPHGPRRAWSRWVATWRKWSRRAIGGAVDTPPRIPWGWHGLNKFGYLKMMCHEIYTVYCILYVISNFTYVFGDIWYIYIYILILIYYIYRVLDPTASCRGKSSDILCAVGKLMPDTCCPSSFVEGLRSMTQVPLAWWSCSCYFKRIYSHHFMATIL